MHPNYLPTLQDILYARTKSIGIFETRFTHDRTRYQFFDVGGTRGERRKWIHTFANVDALIFTCDVSNYDAVLLEDNTQNRMLEQLLLFDSVINSRWFSNIPVVVMFTKVDKLCARKLLASPFQTKFPDYNGHPESIEDILDYLVLRFKKVTRRPNGMANGVNLDVVFLCASNISSSGTNMGELATTAIQKRFSFPN